MPPHHQVLSHFTPYAGEVQAYYWSDFLGSKINYEYQAGFGPPYTEDRTPPPQFPHFNEEYFEWIDLLESVLEARETFNMIELGAGFGRWVVRGALAARQRNRPFRLAAVEAEPAVYGWLRSHFTDNGIDPDDHLVLHGAVTETPGDVMFYIGGPRGGPFDRNPNGWYGQRLTDERDVSSAPVPDGEYRGFPVTRHASGWRSIPVPSVSLSRILRGFDRVDLIDMDIEGEELPSIRANIETLDAKVKRLHIGTHSTEIEARLREILTAHGWKCLADYSLFSTAETAWGKISFENGVQSWINPRA